METPLTIRDRHGGGAGLEERVFSEVLEGVEEGAGLEGVQLGLTEHRALHEGHARELKTSRP